MRLEPARLAPAIADYLEFLKRGYPESPTRELVANRRRLTKPERVALYRGVFAPETSARRRAKLVPPDALPDRLRESALHVDGHNVLYTIANHLRGVPLFIATDGVVRDVGEIHADEMPRAIMERAAGLFGAWIDATGGTRVTVHLDERLPAADEHARILAARLGVQPLVLRQVETGRHGSQTRDATVAPEDRVGITLDVHPDRVLAASCEGVIATSDGEVIDMARGGVVDLARLVLDSRFGREWIDLGEILARVQSSRPRL